MISFGALDTLLPRSEFHLSRVRQACPAERIDRDDRWEAPLVLDRAPRGNEETEDPALSSVVKIR